MLLQTFVHKFLHAHMFLFLLDMYLRVELLGSVVTLCLAFKGLSGYSPRQLHHFPFASVVHEVSNSSISLPPLVVISPFDDSQGRPISAHTIQTHAIKKWV